MLNELTRALKIYQINSYHQLFDFCLEFSNNNQSLLLRSILQVMPLKPAIIDLLIL